MTSSRTAVFVVLLTLCAVPARAADGILIVMRQTSGGSTTTNEVQITPDRMRGAMTDASGTRQTIIFDGSKQVLYMIDDSRKSYQELTKAEVDKLGAQMQQAMAEMKKQLESLPPAQRQQIEQMLAGRGGIMASAMAAVSAAIPQYKPAGTATVGRWMCTRYEGFVNGQKTSEVCAVEPSALGFTEADFAVTKQLADFIRGLVPQSLTQLFSLGSVDDRGFSGLPVRIVESSGGREETIELADARRETFADSVFAVPAGYQRQAFSLTGR